MHDLKTLPTHLAIIMDGNGRWAKQRKLPRFVGHQYGVKSLRKIVEECAKLGVEYLTLFAFSSENWQRPEEEVSALMGLFSKLLDKEVDHLIANNVRLLVVGDKNGFSERLQKEIQSAESKTADCTGTTLTLAANYGARNEILQACKNLMHNTAKDAATIDALTERDLAQQLSTQQLGIPDPDLLIRTSGDVRISNFLLWQIAYSEMYFSPVYWPDFDEQELHKALTKFADSERRFGKTSEQLDEDKATC